MNEEITIQVILERPLPGVLYALQKGTGVQYESIQPQVASDQDLIFEGVIKLKGDGVKYDYPDFGGPLVQGIKTARFLYIDIGRTAKQMGSEWSRRLKIPLTGISWEMVRQLQTLPNPLLQTKVPGIGKDGGPNCATVKPFAGWHIKK